MVTDRRRVLGRGLGALIPTGLGEPDRRPSDILFYESASDVSRETSDKVVEARPELEAAPSAPEQSSQADNPHLDQSRDQDDAVGGLPAIPGVEFGEIPVDDIRPNARQPRQAFDEDELAELSTSIREIGLLQPIVVRPCPVGDEQRYELVVGERRWRAAVMAGLSVIPAIVKNTGDDVMLRDALLENLHRVQLNPLEEAAAYQQLLDDFECTHEHLAERIGRSRSQITNTVRLLRLPPMVARRVAAGVLTAGHARALLGLTDGAEIERVAQRIVSEGLSVRAVEELVALGTQVPGPRSAPRRAATSPEMENLASSLGDHLDTQVRITLGQRKGRLTVDFASTEDLERILATLGLADLTERATSDGDASATAPISLTG